MNEGERKRDARIAGWSDVDLLRTILHDTTEAVSKGEHDAFQDMLNGLCALQGHEHLSEGARVYLSKKQRTWAEEVARRVVPVRAADVPQGEPVITPDVLRRLPKAPPGRAPR